MRRSPIFMLIAAFICAAAAALLARTWMSGHGPETVTVSKEIAAPSATVIVAARDVRPGDKLTADALKEIQWPAAAVPKGVYATKDAVLKAAGEHGAYTKIWANVPFLPQHFSAEEGMLADRLGGDSKGVTIRVNEVAGVAGFVQPEDRVDVLLTTTVAPGNEGAAGAQINATTRTLLRNVRVLATDQQTQRRPQAAAPKTVTLETNSVESAALTLAGNIGQLSLVLNRAGNDGKAEAPPEIVRVEDLLGTGARAVTAQNGANVVVTRSTEKTEYKVRPEGTQ